MANETFELYSLTNKLELDTTQFDRAYGASRQKMTTLAGDYGKLTRASEGWRSGQGKLNQILGSFQSTLTGLGGPLTGTITHYTSMLGLTQNLSGATLGLNAALGLALTGGLALAGGMFALAKKAADAGDEIYDLTQKVNFSAESISTLKLAGETAGVEFAALSATLGIINKNVDAANAGDRQLSATFRALNIDIRDNETALRGAFRALRGVEDEAQQVALALKLFGKGGKEILGIIKETNGDLDAAMAKYRQLGTLITTESAEAANEFSDTLKKLEQQFEAVTRAIGERFMPTVVSAMEAVNAALDKNRNAASSWATDLVSIVSFAAEQIGHILEGLRIVMEGYRKTFGEGSFFGDMVKGETERKLMALPDGRVMDLNSRETFDLNKPEDKNRFFGVPNRWDDPGEYAVPYGRPAPSKPKGRINIPGGGGGGGRGGGYDPASDIKRLAELQLQTTIETNRREESDIERSFEKRKTTVSTYQRAMMRLEGERHRETMDALKAEQTEIQKNPKLNELQKSVALQQIALERAREMNRHREREATIEQNINNLTRERIALTETLIKLQTRGRYSRDVILEDLGGGSVQVDEQTRSDTQRRTRRVSDRTRPRIATEAEEARRRQRREQEDRIYDFAADLTSAIDQAIADGFRGGLKKGVISFGLGILEMARHEALNQLQKAIADALFGAVGSDGKGSIFRQLISTGLNAIVGLFGGGNIFGGGSAGGIGSAAGGAVGGKAAGGYVPPYATARFQEYGEEYVTAGPSGATVTPGRSGPVNNVYMTVYAQDARSFARRETQTQIRNRMLRELKAAA